MDTPRPIVITSRADMASILAAARKARSETCLAADNRAGFHDGYTAKLEHPDSKSGKRGLHISAMAEVWLQANGYVLALMTVEQSVALGAVKAA